MFGNRWNEAGTFELLSGTLAIGDPCVRRLGEGDAGVLVDARPGSWRVSYAQTDSAPAALQAVHGFAAPDALHWVEAARPLVVDSGQVGVIDERFHRPDDDRWSIRCRRLTSTHPFAGSFPAGAVSAAYFGKGSYPLLIARGVDGRVLGVRVLFLDPVEQMADAPPREHCGSVVKSHRGFELVPYAAS
jgi:hypothetical protein